MIFITFVKLLFIQRLSIRKKISKGSICKQGSDVRYIKFHYSDVQNYSYCNVTTLSLCTGQKATVHYFTSRAVFTVLRELLEVVVTRLYHSVCKRKINLTCFQTTIYDVDNISVPIVFYCFPLC